MSQIVKLEFIPVSVPYARPEVSRLVNRLGVTDILVRATDADGRIGWGESCSGANAESVLEALRAMEPFVPGDPLGKAKRSSTNSGRPRFGSIARERPVTRSRALIWLYGTCAERSADNRCIAS